MIGVFDSGIGGLTVLRAMQKSMPETGFLYYGDHANSPYGTRTEAEIHEYTRNAVRLLFDMGCDLVVLACNTASAVALHDLQTEWLPQNDEGRDRRVLGVFVPMIEAMTDRDWGDNAPPTHTGLRDVLLFATDASVKSGAFSRELRFRARDVQVEAIACHDLVPAIEAGDEEVIKLAVKKYVAQGLDRLPDPQTAALACTHYPIAAKHFAAELPKETMVFSQPFIVAKALFDYVNRHQRFSNTLGVSHFITSGDGVKVSQEASNFIGDNIVFESI